MHIPKMFSLEDCGTAGPWSFAMDKLQYSTAKVIVPQGVNHWINHSITAG